MTDNKKPLDSVLLGIVSVLVGVYAFNTALLPILTRLFVAEIPMQFRVFVWGFESLMCAIAVIFAYRSGRKKLGLGLILGTVFCIFTVLSFFVLSHLME